MSVNTSRTILYRNDKCCQESRVSSTAEISSSVNRPCQTYHKGSAPNNSQRSYKEEAKGSNDTNQNEEKTNSEAKKVGTVVLSTAQKSQLNKPAHVVEQCPYRTRCYQCKDLVHRIRSLLDEIKAIRRNVTPGTICEFCKRYSTDGKCRRCEYLQDRYKISENIEDEARQQRFKIWLCKVKQFLFTILERETCKHKVYPKTPATDELTNLLHELKSPLTIREPEIGYFPSIDSLENITESKDILEEVLMRLRSEKRSEDFMPEATCVCKYFADKKVDETGTKKDISVEEPAPPPTPQAKDTTAEVKIKKDEKSKAKEPKKPKERPPKEVKKPPPKEEKKPPPKAEKKPLPPKEKKPLPPKPPKQEDIMEKMMKQNFMPIEPKQPKVTEKLPVVAKIDDLPLPVIKELKDIDSASGSIFECEVGDGDATEMIKGTKIVPIEPRKGLDSGSVQPMLFKTAPECPEPKNETPSTTTPVSMSLADKIKKVKSKVEMDDKASGKGVIRYMLSNREFIEKGWTLLPTTKIMRRMNIYKMIPANPKLDWFERHKMKRILNYDSGEKLAEFQEDGSGKLYYKNGSLALDYYCAKENTGFRYIIYSSGDNTDAGKKLPVTVLASFDYQGNAVIYDHYGNERLKYNQSEGMVFDSKIGPPGRWKWHTLNEPPVLQPVFVDVRVRPNACLEEYFKTRKDDDKLDPGSKHKKEPNSDMLAIELENFLKEKAQALLQEFKPFQIRMKALKLNDQFSLKVIDQANIYLLFRDGQTSIKLNLGLILISNEIIDTDTAEVTQVATPYDHRPPKSESIADIQIALEKARKLGKARGKLRN